MTYIPVGKLPSAFLEDLIERYISPDPRVLVGPGIGEDAAVIDMGRRCLVAKTDPVTFASDEIGWYAVHVNANDVACCGAVPRWFLATVLLPEGRTTSELAERIFRQIAEACRGLGVSLCGGHTEITYGLERPIVVGQMLGEVERDGWIRTGGAQVGDAVILTKGIAVEGTAVVAREKGAALAEAVSAETLERAARYLHAPGISVVREARVALEVGGVHALHDPTEGGVATGLWELAQAAGVGLHVEEASLPILPECEQLCRHLGLDPLGLIGSGALLIAAARQRAQAMVRRLRAEDVPATIIGEVMPADTGCRLRTRDGELRPLPSFRRDEIARLFD
ncbi:MAG: hydrogenase expression protein [Gammaproteobacteria bacterium]|nr:hydrogenase expression protein [Gammaproteobacteria bacterium]NIR83568.1 hydrogenase expression protein [Gammaproteobacteria bacterium]NIR91490.1 hydrogenase expression protein [Gammaproteobacteria bacterium]NIU04730.1 hydrogenase expression protein [Gammaproteobacteria bacterium]NIV51772.1 hydrogenase expression protein [Gammaproteobacteria bacterium]